jgi:hypothetical protein
MALVSWCRARAGNISTATKAVRPDRTVPSWCCPAQGYVIVGLANVDPDAIGNVVNYIARRLPL